MARAKTAPSAAGSSASSPNRLPRRNATTTGTGWPARPARPRWPAARRPFHRLDDIVRISVGFHGPNGIEHVFGCLLGGSHRTRSLWTPSNRRSLRAIPEPGRLPYGERLPQSFVQPDRTIVGDSHDV